MADQRLARLLAPLALVAAVIGIAVVIGTSGSSTSVTSHPSVPTSHRTRSAKPRPHVYIVKAGDTLTLIASKAGVTVDALERLNPDVDPQALHAGERLKLGP